jgi:site-specific DNA-methyltransferase (adenine-specific)
MAGIERTPQRYTLYHGDCLDVLPQIAPQSVDAVICDPPYGTTACTWDSVIPFEPMWEQLRRVIKPRGAIVLFGSQPFTSALVMSNPGMFRHEWIWVKNQGSNFANTVREPMKEHESVIVFGAGGWTYNPIPQERAPSGQSRAQYKSVGPLKSENYQTFAGDNRPTRPTLRLPSSWQKFNVERGLHPTQKPLSLLEYLVRTYTNAGDTVLDFALGSGTTGHACGNLGRAFIGIERDQVYFDIASERIASAYAPLGHMQAAVLKGTYP